MSELSWACFIVIIIGVFTDSKDKSRLINFHISAPDGKATAGGTFFGTSIDGNLADTFHFVIWTVLYFSILKKIFWNFGWNLYNQMFNNCSILIKEPQLKLTNILMVLFCCTNVVIFFPDPCLSMWDLQQKNYQQFLTNHKTKDWPQYKISVQQNIKLLLLLMFISGSK